MMISVSNDEGATPVDVFGRRLRERREAAELTQAQLAAASGVAQSYISQMETGTSGPPTIDRAYLFARACVTSIDYLAGLTDDPTPPQGGQWPEGAEEMLRLMRDLSPERAAELIGMGRVMLEAQRKRAKTDADTSRIAEYLRRTGNPAETDRGIGLVLVALRDGDEVSALAALRDILAREGGLPQGAANGPLAQEC